MDIDRFIATNQETWVRLEDLSSRAGRGVRQISAAELDELVMLYQRTSGHLSPRAHAVNDAALNARLGRVLGAARGVVYRRSDNPVRAVGRFFSETFPAAVWYSRRFVAVAAFLLFAPALAMGIWLANDADALRNSIDPTQARALAANEFADYYSSDAAGAFQAKITTNNIQVSVLAFGSGVLLGIPTILLLASNGANIGVAAAVMQHYGKGTQFWGLITPHGLLEITAITIAGAARAPTRVGHRGPGRPQAIRRSRRRGSALRPGRRRHCAVLRHRRIHRGLDHPVGAADRGAGRHRGRHRGNVHPVHRGYGTGGRGPGDDGTSR